MVFVFVDGWFCLNLNWGDWGWVNLGKSFNFFVFVFVRVIGELY